MTERHRRARVPDARPPSRHMRSLLRQAFFEVHRMLRGLRHATRLSPDEAVETMRVLEFCRRATARDPYPYRLARLSKSVPPGHAEAVAALDIVLAALAAIAITWDRRLIAAGIDPAWPDSAA